jgi:hypothetical protein
VNAQERVLIKSQVQLEKITAIVTRLDEHLSEAHAENRRRLPRVAMRTELTFILLGEIVPSAVDVYSRNISQSGMGFVSRRMFRADERVVIPLHIPKVPPKLVLARVTFSRYIGGGYYEMGSEFLEVADDMGGKVLGRFPNHWLQEAGYVGAAP